jgi:accessory colonization factor AcfC
MKKIIGRCFMGEKLRAKATLVVVGSADVEAVCKIYGIVNPKITKVDVAEFFSKECIIKSILEAVKVYAPDLLVIATKDGDVIWDFNGLVKYRCIKSFINNN